MATLFKKMNRRKGSSKGFTLLEVMIAMLIFTVGALALTRLSAGTTQGNTVAEGATESSVMGARFLESIISRSYRGTDLDHGTADSFVQDNCTVAYTVSEDALMPGTKHINMTVSFPFGNTTKTLNYHYLLPERK